MGRIREAARPLPNLFFHKKTCKPSPWLHCHTANCWAPGGAVLQRSGCLGCLSGGSHSRTRWWPARRVGWGKNVSVGSCFGGKKKQRATAGGGRYPSPGPGRGGLAQNVDSASRGTFRPEIPHTLPPSTPTALSTLAPWEAWNSGSISGQKDPVTSHLLPWRRTVRSRAALPIRRGRSWHAGPWGIGWASSAPGPRASYSRLTCSKNRSLSR